MELKPTLQQIKSFYRGDNPQEALRLTVELLKEYPHEAKLHRWVRKLKKAIIRQEKQGREQFFKKGFDILNTLYRAGDFENAFKGAQELVEVDSYNRKATHWLKKSRIALVEQRLHDPLRAQWTASGDWEKLYIFYQRLRGVFPEYPKLKALIKESEKKVIEQDRELKKEFAQKSLEELSQFYSEGKYESVIQGAKELIVFTHQGSFEAEKLLKKAIASNEIEIERDTDEYMKNQRPILEAAWQAKTERMVKI